MIYSYIHELILYGIRRGLLLQEDAIYTRNQLLDLFHLDEYEFESSNLPLTHSLNEILDGMLNYAYAQGIIKSNSIISRDLFDTKIMGILMPRPSEVQKVFWEKYKVSPKEATDFYYKLSQDSNYIRIDRVIKDMKWTTNTEYGDLDITINLSKPEKDPKEIAAARVQKQGGYPKCMLCIESEGYAGRENYPARQNHRLISLQICGESWRLQYSPYVYYNEHCIVLNSKHVPMKIDREALAKLLDFIKLFPHYVVGSNADLPIVGGSILAHEHFQGGNYEFAMAKANIEESFTVKGYEDVEAGIVAWPMSVLRIRSKDTNRLIELGDYILRAWRGYSDEQANIYAYTGQEPHNTITPIARKNGKIYELDLVLRNNITTAQYPLGVFHPHQEYHHIKKENIGLIEVMGLAILPSRLKKDMDLLKDFILTGKDIHKDAKLCCHADWVDEFVPKYDSITSENIDEILKKEIGLVFLHVLEQAGVYKRTEDGKNAFHRFIDRLNQ